MNCKDIEGLISSYLDQALTEEEEYNLKKHLSSCSKCRETLEIYQLLQDKCHDLDKELKVPEGFHSDLMNKINDLEASKKKSPYIIRHRILPTIAALFAFVFLLTITKPWIYNTDSTSHDEQINEIENFDASQRDVSLSNIKVDESDTVEDEKNFSIQGTLDKQDTSILTDTPNDTESSHVTDNSASVEMAAPKTLMIDEGNSTVEGSDTDKSSQTGTKTVNEEQALEETETTKAYLYMLLGVSVIVIVLSYIIYKRRN